MRVSIVALLLSIAMNGCFFPQPVEATFSDDLLKAAKIGNEKIINDLLTRGAKVNHVDEYTGRTPLINAARHGHAEIVSKLLDFGANVNQADCHGYTALALAANSGHTNIVSLLLRYGADVNHVDKDFGCTALILAANGGYSKLVSKLLQYGANVNFVDTMAYHGTAIMYAAFNGHSDTVSLLLQGGANVSYVDYYGKTAQLITQFNQLPPEMRVEVMKHTFSTCSDEIGILISKNRNQLTAEQTMLLYLFTEDARVVIAKLKDNKSNVFQVDFAYLPQELRIAIFEKYRDADKKY